MAASLDYPVILEHNWKCFSKVLQVQKNDLVGGAEHASRAREEAASMKLPDTGA